MSEATPNIRRSAADAWITSPDRVNPGSSYSHMNMNEPKLSWQASGWRWLWISAFFIVLDQLTKFWIVVGIPEGQQIYVLPVLNIIHTTNAGAAWSMGADWGGSQRWLLSGLAIVV